MFCSNGVAEGVRILITLDGFLAFVGLLSYPLEWIEGDCDRIIGRGLLKVVCFLKKEEGEVAFNSENDYCYVVGYSDKSAALVINWIHDDFLLMDFNKPNWGIGIVD